MVIPHLDYLAMEFVCFLCDSDAGSRPSGRIWALRLGDRFGSLDKALHIHIVTSLEAN